MRKFREPDREQQLLMTYVNLESAAPIGSAVRTINDLIDALDTGDLEEAYNLEAEKGNHPTHPKTIIKVCLYAIHSCRFSLRKMEYDTKYNLPYRWLTGDRTLDHSTIGKFLVKFKNELVEIFTQTVKLAIEKGLMDFEVLSIDSVKIRANASHKRDRTMSGLDKEMAKIRARVEDIMEKADSDDTAERELEALRRAEARVEEAKVELRRRIEKKSSDKSDREKETIEKKEKINLTDFDSHKMQQASGEINPSYSMTTAVDSGHDIITHFQINEEDNDTAALVPVIEGSSEKCGRPHDVVNADPGFASLDNYEKLEELKQNALIPDRRYEVDERGEQKKGRFDKSHFVYHAEENCYHCPNGMILCLQAEYNAGGKSYCRYTNRAACLSCADRRSCTKSEYRTITRDKKEGYLEKMRLRLSQQVNKEIYKVRSHCSESPNGSIKHNMKYRIYMRRGRNKVSMEGALLCTLHNLLKIGKYAMLNG
jgi:transposase